MKTETKDVISVDLELLQSHLHKIERCEKKLTTCQADMVEMEARIQQIGKPSYKNEKAVDELARLKQRLELCASEAREAEEALPPLMHELYNMLSPVSSRASRLLKPLVDRRINTITAAMMPFCESETSAMNAARATDAFQSAHRAIARVAQPPAPGPAMMRHVRKLISIFEEALKKDGDLLQFLAAPTAMSGAVGEPAEVSLA